MSSNLINKTFQRAELLERNLHLKQLQINRLLSITQAINNNVPTEDLIEMFTSFLSWEMRVKKMILYLLDENGKYNLSGSIGIENNLLQIDIGEYLTTITRLINITNEKHPLISNFDVVIPVNNEGEILAYLFVGVFDEEEVFHNKVQFIVTLTNVVLLAIKNKKLSNDILSYVKFEDKKNDVKKGIIELKGLMALQTAFLQYWNFFNDYIEITKGKKIDFNIKRHQKGLELEIKLTNDLSELEVETYLNEYQAILMSKKVDLTNHFDRTVLVKEIDLLNLQIRQQKSSFERQIDILATTNKILLDDKANFLRLLEVVKMQPIQIQLLQEQKTDVNQTSIIKIEETINFGTTFSEFVHVMKQIDKEKSLNYKEAEVIQDAIDEIENKDLPKGIKTKIERFLSKSLSKIKDAKAILIDTPAVAKMLLSSLIGIVAYLQNFGTEFSLIIKTINDVLSTLK